MTSNVKQQYAGSDFIGGNSTAKGAIETLFRPSDVAVGPDGAFYVSDWIDPRVGGHQDLDETVSGAIYRIAPKGFMPKVPAFDASTVEGLITALRSPAVNVRAIGFEGLKARGAAAVERGRGAAQGSEPLHAGPRHLPAVSARSRGPPSAQARLSRSRSRRMRIAAYRAMRRAGLDVMPVAAQLARDADPGVRREVALSMRDQPAGPVARHPGRRRPRLRRPGSHLPRSAGHRRDRQGTGALRSAQEGARRC